MSCPTAEQQAARALGWEPRLTDLVMVAMGADTWTGVVVSTRARSGVGTPYFEVSPREGVATTGPIAVAEADIWPVL